MMKAGAVGYLLKSEAPETIVAAVRAAARAQLIQERRMAYADELERRLVSQAKARIFKDKLPPAAQTALAEIAGH